MGYSGKKCGSIWLQVGRNFAQSRDSHQTPFAILPPVPRFTLLSPPPSVAHRRPRLRGVLAALVLVASTAEAAPDLITQERTLLDNAAQKSQVLVQQVRDRASDLVVSAMTFLGVRYRRGGNSAEEGFDCSGFTRHVFERTLGLVLPRRADEQANAPGWFAVQREELKPGDLVFFNTLRRTFSHVGIYIGEGKFIHAPRSGKDVRIEDMREAYWAKRFTGARRTPLAGDALAPALAPVIQTAAPIDAPPASRGAAGLAPAAR